MKAIRKLDGEFRRALLLTTCGLVAASAGAGDAAARNASAIRTALHASVRFGSGNAQLDDAALRYVAALGVALANSAARDITVSGYADAQGTGQFNLNLSQQRAEAVKRVLEAAGVDSARIHLEANGEWFSQQLDADPSSLAAQRRVEINAQAAS